MKLLPKLLVFVGLACVSVAHLGRAAVPSGCYVAQNGTVYDRRTKLTWQQPVDPGTYTWAQATAYCQGLTLSGGGWRLPSVMELVSIMDYSRTNPSIDPVAFPGNVVAGFWTATVVSGPASNAWIVEFYSGRVYPFDVRVKYMVRCVR